MKKLLIIVLTMMWATGLHAQAPKTWFDGDAYFTESFLGGGILYYTGTSADKEYDFSFGLEPMIDGSFKLVKCTDTDKIPFRAEWGQLHSGEFHDKSLIQMDESTEVKITNMPLGKRPVGPDTKFMN
ncbi:MAG: hypothetical protein II318_01020 [Bacteroidales bacterium]|nr:hypothetical protein [Bacteroidales bacterium]